MSYGYPNQGPPPSYNSTFDDGEPLFTSPPEERYPSMKHTPYQHSTSIFGAPPMGEPAEPSAHPDNKTAATQTAGPSSVTGGLGRQPSSSFENPTASWGDGGLRRQSSGAYDASTGFKTDHGFFSGATQHSSTPSAYRQQTASQPGVAGTVPAGMQPGSPYVQTQSVPAAGPMSTIVQNFNKYMGKAELFAENIWSHMKTSPSVLDAAQGRMSQGIKLVQEGGFEGLYKSTFGLTDGEQLRKTYACYLSTSTGPVSGTLFISNLKFSFCSDRPLSYSPAPGQQAWSYYKMVVPLDKVKEVIPSFNENKPQERYIQIVTVDGHDFWFMGFVNYDKGVMNMQLALKHIGEIDPTGGLKSSWAGISVPGMKKTVPGMKKTVPGMKKTVPGMKETVPGMKKTAAQQPSVTPTTSRTPNYDPHAPNPYTSNYK